MYHHLHNIVYYPYHDTVRMTHFCSNLAELLSLFRKSINYFFLVSHSDKHISNCAHVCSQTSLYFPVSQSSRSHARSHTRACARARAHTHTHTHTHRGASTHTLAYTHSHTEGIVTGFIQYIRYRDSVSGQGWYAVTQHRDKSDTLGIPKRVIHSSSWLGVVTRVIYTTQHRDKSDTLGIVTRVKHSISWLGFGTKVIQSDSISGQEWYTRYRDSVSGQRWYNLNQYRGKGDTFGIVTRVVHSVSGRGWHTLWLSIETVLYSVSGQWWQSMLGLVKGWYTRYRDNFIHSLSWHRDPR